MLKWSIMKNKCVELICLTWVKYFSMAVITNYHQLHGIEQHKFITSEFCTSEVHEAWLVSLLESPKSEIRLLALRLLLGNSERILFQALSSTGQIQFHAAVDEGLISLLDVSQVLFLDSRGSHVPWLWFPSFILQCHHTGPPPPSSSSVTSLCLPLLL